MNFLTAYPMKPILYFVLFFLLQSCSSELEYGILPPTSSALKNETEEDVVQSSKSSSDSIRKSSSSNANIIESGCETLTLCKGKCETFECMEMCERSISKHDINKSNDLILCMLEARKTCSNSQCEVETCRHKVDICGGRVSYSCKEIFACVDHCTSNNPFCETYCLDLADKTTKSAVEEVANCYHALEHEEDFEYSCKAEIKRCGEN